MTCYAFDQLKKHIPPVYLPIGLSAYRSICLPANLPVCLQDSLNNNTPSPYICLGVYVVSIHAAVINAIQELSYITWNAYHRYMATNSLHYSAVGIFSQLPPSKDPETPNPVHVLYSRP